MADQQAAAGELVVHEAAWTDLDPATAYGIAMLRSMVFVVEQHCPYLDLDGRDMEPGARQLWMAQSPAPADASADPAEGGTVPGGIVAAARLLPEPAGWRIGRVVTAPAHRRRGLAEALMAHALARPGPFVLDAQTYLTGWYGRFGFEADGPEFVEDGIPHTPMRRP